jgi:transposase InsO family protein
VPGAFATLDFPLTDVQVFHADRGGGFDDTEIDEPLDVFDVKGSPPRRGGPHGNAVVESMDRLLKKELVYRNSYATIGQLRRGPDDCVWWSDNRRLHSTLGYRSPKEFTEQGLVL